LRSNDVRQLAYNPLTDELFAATPFGVSVYRQVSNEWYDSDFFPDSLVQPWESLDITRATLPFGYDALTPGFITDSELRSYPIQGAIEDPYGNWWVATWGDFVWSWKFGTFDLVPQRWGLFNNAVSAIYQDSKRLYFGGTDPYDTETGFSVYRTTDRTWDYYQARYTEGLVSDNINRIVGSDTSRFVWLGTDRGVTRFNRENGEFRTYDHRAGLSDDVVWGLFLDGDILWVGTDFGIDGIFLPADSVFNATTDPVRGARIYDIDVIDGVVWLGTDRGLYRLVKPTPAWYRFAPEEGPLAGRIRAITHDANHIYIGSDRGIGIIDREGNEPIQSYESPSVLPDDDIYDIAVTADSILWAATPSGLFRFVPATMERRLFTQEDGLIDIFVETIVVDGDYLWLGTLRGANRFRWNNPLRID
jgi:ligand-binding sensor domain-containing protein